MSDTPALDLKIGDWNMDDDQSEGVIDYAKLGVVGNISPERHIALAETKSEFET